MPTVTFRALYVFIVLCHDRRRVVHFNVTDHPYAEWAAQQIIDAFPYDEAPRFPLRDRDGIYGDYFKKRVKDMGIEEVLIAPRAPWQNPFCDRVIGSIRRDCLDHVIVLNEAHLHRILMVMAILGGAVAPLLMGRLADRFSIRIGFLMPLACFAAVAAYGFCWKTLFSRDMVWGSDQPTCAPEK